MPELAVILQRLWWVVFVLALLVGLGILLSYVT